MYYMYFSSGTFYFRKKSSTSIDSALCVFEKDMHVEKVRERVEGRENTNFYIFEGNGRTSG